jgi:hypothetical protein
VQTSLYKIFEVQRNKGVFSIVYQNKITLKGKEEYPLAVKELLDLTGSDFRKHFE